MLGRGLFLLAVITLLMVLPAVSDLALVSVLIKVFIAALFAMGFNLLWGHAGLLSFGHAAYFAIGTFAALYIMEAIDHGSSFPTPLVPLVGAAAGFALGLIAGWFATIRSGVAFAMITLALGELIHAVVIRWSDIFGGEAGVRSVRSPWGPFDFQSTTDVYYFTLAWCLIGLLALWSLQRSPLGIVIRGIREREERVRFLGYNVHTLKTLVFAFSASVSGLAGGLLAFANESGNVVLFGSSNSTGVLLNTVIGGASVFLGPALGALLTTLFGYYVGNITHYWMLYLGMLFLAVIVIAPRGLAGAIVERFQYPSGHKPSNIANLRLLSGGFFVSSSAVLAVEMIGSIFSANKAPGERWPSIAILGISWSPASVVTWLVVAACLGVGVMLLHGVVPKNIGLNLRALFRRAEARRTEA